MHAYHAARSEKLKYIAIISTSVEVLVGLFVGNIVFNHLHALSYHNMI